jgi:nicotinamide mononucleotide (NMN) deamidase PncC
VFIGVDARVGGHDSHAVSRLALAGDRSEIRAQTVLAALDVARGVGPRNG